MFRSFQNAVMKWAEECFTPRSNKDPANQQDRIQRFVEEAMELAQSLDLPKDHAHDLVEYVYGRPKGEPFQEVGGTIVTLSRLCSVFDIDLHTAAWTEIERASQPEVMEKIRAKDRLKPKHSALPGKEPTP